MAAAITSLLLLLAAPALAYARHGARGALRTLPGILAWIALAGCARPFAPAWDLLAPLGAAAVFVASLRAPPQARAPEGRTASRVALALVAGALVPLGAAELAVEAAWRAGWIEVFEPTRLELGPGLSPAAGLLHVPGTEDWRLAHVVGDELREFDPVLLWRSIPAPPYNAQRFKGPLVALPKPANTFRLLAYGDSNTDGPPDRSAWPQYLQGLLERWPGAEGRRYEVLNAGVAGYSSYQGLQRARQEAERYEPDLLLVSFGWNDLPAAVGQPDKSFRPPAAAFVALLERLARSKLFLWFKQLSLVEGPPQLVGPRVSIDDYEQNLAAFLELARARGIGVAFLTRPHRLTEGEQRALPGWRGSVPDYNDRVRAFAARVGATLIDVQRHFEARADPEGDFYDDAHFSEAGHNAMSELVLERLREDGLLVPAR